MQQRNWRVVNKASLGIPASVAAAYVAICTLVVGVAQFDDRAKSITKDQLTFWLGLQSDRSAMIIALSIVAIFALMWIISHNKIDDFDDIESKMVGYPLPLIPDHQQIVTGQVNAVEEGDTMTATGTTGLHGLYIGNIIASASGLRDEHRLELAIVGYNGTGEAVSISGISGHIRAGAGNFRDMTVLPIPAIRNSVRVEPWSEFVLVLNQHLAPAQAKEFLAALDDKQVQLDLKELKINAVSAANIDRSMPLPLWDAVSLRRRDDIISNRVHVLRVGAATEIKASLGMLVARVDGTTEKRDA